MKNVFVGVLCLMMVGVAAAAAPLSTGSELSFFPTYLKYYGTLSQSSSLISINISTEDGAAYGTALRTSAIGDDYTITADCKWDGTAKTEIGLSARVDTANSRLYTFSYNPNNNYLTMVKVSGGGFNNLKAEQLGGFSFDYSKSYTMQFSVVGSQLDGYMYDGSTLVRHISYVDDGSKGGAALTSGKLGTWFYQPVSAAAMVGQWANATYDVPEPMTMALLAMGGVGLLRRRMA